MEGVTENDAGSHAGSDCNPVFARLRQPKAATAAPDSHFREMRALLASGGPLAEDFPRVHRWIARSQDLIANGAIAKSDVHSFWRTAGDEYLSETMQGLALQKRYGYAGDFEIIDRIYTRHVTPHPHYSRWDMFFHAQAAPQAVRNRKDVFKSLLTGAIAGRQGIVRVLNLGCGPCRDIAEFLRARPDARLACDCIDQDARAIEYARDLLGPLAHSAEVSFINANVIRLREERDYDLVWSAGLFDYLPDGLFVQVLRRLLKRVRAGGRAVIGNFAEGQPSRGYMELVGDWMLYYRTRDRLVELATEAGASVAAVSVTEEEEGINLFLIVDG